MPFETPAILSLLGLEPSVDAVCSIAVLLAGGNAEEMDCSAGMPGCTSLEDSQASHSLICLLRASQAGA